MATVVDAAAEEAAAPRIVTREELKKHATIEDCWIAIHGRIYDVTSYSEDHPGGPDVLKAVAGGDATTEFEDTSHSLDARRQALKYEVGILEGFEGKAQGAMAGRKVRAKDLKSKDKRLALWMNLYTPIALVAMAAVAVFVAQKAVNRFYP